MARRSLAMVAFVLSAWHCTLALARPLSVSSSGSSTVVPTLQAAGPPLTTMDHLRAFGAAFVQAQKDQIHSEVERVRSIIPPGIVSFHRRPQEVATQAGQLVGAFAISYVESAALGYVFGLGQSTMYPADKKKVYKRLVGRAFQHKVAVKQAKEFGGICSAFTLFEGLTSLCRGVDDKWNNVVGSTAVGIYLNRRKKTIEMIKMGATYGGINLLLSAFSGTEGEKKPKKESPLTSRLREWTPKSPPQATPRPTV